MSKHLSDSHRSSQRDVPTVAAATFDMAANRRSQKWTRKEQMGRIFWALVQPLFRLSPSFFWCWRRILLRCFGARIARNVHIHPSVRVTIPWNLEVGEWSAIGFDAVIYNLGPVRLGRRVTISQRVHLCAGTHDFRDAAMPLEKPPITINDDAWICADAFVGPGVNVGASSRGRRPVGGR